MVTLSVSEWVVDGGLEVVVPSGHVALSGDLEVHVQGGWAGLTGRLHLLQRATEQDWQHMGTVPLTWTNTTQAQARFPCGVITSGGSYGIKLTVDTSKNLSTNNQVSERNPN